MPDELWSANEYKNIWLPYCQMKTAPMPIKVAATEREFLILEDGRRVIDGIASWWTSCHGYNHPHIVAAVTKQLQRMPHVMMGGLCHDQALKLTSRLAKILPGTLDRIFLADSGSVAVEVALKIAAQYWINQGQPNRKRFICFHNAYHGDTTGAMSVCDPVDSMHAHFKGFLLEQFPASIPKSPSEFEAFETFIESKRDIVAGVIIEPMSQMWGMQFQTADQLRKIYEISKRQNMLLIADEIATGFYRTGKMFAVNHADIVPDIMCLGKALTGGFLTLSAAAATAEVYRAFHSDNASHALMHGPTFMGNPLACAAANASLDLFESNPPDDSISERFASAAKNFRGKANVSFERPNEVVDVRSLGALLAIEFAETLPSRETRDFFLERGIWLRPIDNVLYVCPSLNMPLVSLEKILTAISDFLR